MRHPAGAMVMLLDQRDVGGSVRTGPMNALDRWLVEADTAQAG
ncbi:MULTISPECIES: hypothetical protein [unclassified Mameliella]|nr:MULTISPECIES: hypothetical protein [unclassified Mameliella]